MHRHAQRAPHIIFNSLQHFGIVLQSLLGILATLAQTFALIRKPRAALFDYSIITRQIKHVAFA